MATTHPTPERGTDRFLNRLESDPTLARHQEIGVDAEGYVHHLDRATGHVHRVDAASRERVCDLGLLDAAGGAAVEAYVHEYVGA